MFDIHQAAFDVDGGYDEERCQGYIRGLLEEFAASPEAQGLETDCWAYYLIEKGINYLGVTPADMTLREFNEIVLELFPRKISTPPESAAEIITCLRAFWTFAERQYQLANATLIIVTLTDDAVVRLQGALADPRNYGMAKSILMQGQQAGFDMGTQEGLDRFMLAYTSRVLTAHEPSPLARYRILTGIGPVPPTGTSHEARAEKRKVRKRQRQARKRSRR